MIAKTFEIRDSGTHIPALGIQLRPGCDADRRLLARAGYGVSPEDQAHYVFLCKLAGDVASGTYDPFGWKDGSRTMNEAHRYIEKHFAELETGAVVDVQFILGETAAPKKSEN